MNARPLQHFPLFQLCPRLFSTARGSVTVRAGGEAIWLRRRQVLTIAGASAAGGIRVLRGAVWLTGTPAEKDFVLEAEASLGLMNHYPYVIEALTEAEIVLVR